MRRRPPRSTRTDTLFPYTTLFRSLAEAGLPEAADELGKAYRYGNGVPKDTERAAQWLIAAVSRSHSRWPHASYHLGTMFKAGEGVPQDFALAARLLQQAADNGYLRANLPLAQLYARGQGVEKDLGRARELALRSADSGTVGKIGRESCRES